MTDHSITSVNIPIALVTTNPCWCNLLPIVSINAYAKTFTGKFRPKAVVEVVNNGSFERIKEVTSRVMSQKLLHAL